MNGRRNTTAARNECFTALFVHGHDRRIAEQAAEFNRFADTLAVYGNDAHGGSFLIDHANGNFIGNQGAEK